MEVFESSIAADLRRNLPFLATTTLLMEGVKRGGGRETLHDVLRKHSIAVARGLRDGSLGEDAAFPLNEAEIKAVLGDPSRFLGAAPAQVDAFAKHVAALRQRFPHAEGYRPEPIL